MIDRYRPTHPLRVVLPLGRVLATPGALAALAGSREAAVLLDRHARGDWGDVDAHDRAANDAALVNGERVLSSYTLGHDHTIWIITEADRSCTTLLLPSEY